MTAEQRAKICKRMLWIIPGMILAIIGDYCIVGDKHPMATEYELKQADNCLWISEKTRHPKET